MKKLWVWICLVIAGILVLEGCSLIRVEEEPRTPLEYEVVKPEEILRLIEEKNPENFK